jgi:hypothetical protein
MLQFVLLCAAWAYCGELIHVLLLDWCRCTLRLALWRSSQCVLAMEEVTREDQEQHECQDQLNELLEVRLGITGLGCPLTRIVTAALPQQAVGLAPRVGISRTLCCCQRAIQSRPCNLFVMLCLTLMPCMAVAWS